jgi:hypothetical protein
MNPPAFTHCILHLQQTLLRQVIHDGVAFPLLITMLNKRGNSHTDILEIIEDRHARKATIIASQLSVGS